MALPRPAPKRTPRPALPPPRRARAPVRHVTLPFHVNGAIEPLFGETIGAFLIRTEWATPLRNRYAFRLPTICVVNGTPLPQRQWKRRRIRPNDVVEFWSRPWGKSGKSIFGIVALVALAAFAPWAGAALFGAGTTLASVASGAILLGGSLLISALTAPKVGGQPVDSTNSQIEQLATASASGNSAKLFQPIPVQYGRIKSYPDFAATPWSEYEGNDQYLNVLLSTGLGKYSYETLYIDDTILWTSASGTAATWSNVSLAFYDPGETVTLFPTNVVQSSEVSGQDLSTTPVGGFVANPSGSEATALAIDLVFPNGCSHLHVDESNGNTSLEAVGVTVVAEARAVNDAGAPVGAWTTLASSSYSFATRSPQRATFKATVSAGRYEVRVYRTTAPATDDRTSDGVVWAGLRSFIQGPASYPVSTVAIRIKANNQLTQSSASKFGVLCTRILNVWNATTQVFEEQATRNPFWAEYDAATNTDYGIGRPPSKVDFQTIFDQATAADTRGDTFDYRFVSSVAAPDALDTILKTSRSRHRWSGDVLTFVRDEWSDVPRMLLTDREIVRGTFSVEYALNTDDAADAVILEYVDEDTWGPAEVQYPPNSLEFTAINPSRIQLDGGVNRERNYKEAGFYYLQSQMRRVNVSLDTEHDGRMLGFGSRVRVQSELPLSWGSTGAVLSAAGATLTVDPAPTWAASGNHYIAIRTKIGKQFGPVLCTQGTDAGQIVLNASDLATVEAAQGVTLADALDRADGADDPSFDFGPSDARGRDCIVMTGRPSQDRVTLGLVVDNQAVHDTDLGDTPVAPSAPALQDPKVPLVAGLTASFKQGVAEPTIFASWWPSAGAQYYVAQVSYDTGESWAQIYEGAAPTLTQIVDLANVRLRVQAVGQRTGPFSFVDVTAPTITIAPGTVADSSLQAGLHDYVLVQLKDTQDKLRSLQQVIASSGADLDAATQLQNYQLKTVVSQQFGAVTAQIQQVQDTIQDEITGQITVINGEITTLGNTLTGTQANVSELQVVTETLDGKLTAAWLVTLDVNGHVSGIKAYNDGDTSAVIINTDIFQVALPGETGGDPVPVFTIAEVDGEPKLVLRADMVSDSSIKATNMDVTELSAITGNVGRLTAGKIADGATDSASHMVIDLANGTITGYA